MPDRLIFFWNFTARPRESTVSADGLRLKFGAEDVRFQRRERRGAFAADAGRGRVGVHGAVSSPAGRGLSVRFADERVGGSGRGRVAGDLHGLDARGP